MNENIHKDKFPSGVSFEVKELTGKHQRLLTEQSSKTHNEKLDSVLLDVIVKIGTETSLDEKFIESMLACDKQKALVTVRQFTMDFDPTFDFAWEYKTEAGEKAEHRLSIPLGDGSFPSKPVMILNKDGLIVEDEETPEYVTLECYLKKLLNKEELEYSDILAYKNVEIILPRSKERVRFTMLDAEGELLLTKIPKSDRSTHTPIRIRKPVKFDEETNTPIQLNLDRLAYKDIEFLREEIKKVEGNVDTEVMFEHPESHLKAPSEKDVIVDLLGTTAFFFPSGAI